MLSKFEPLCRWDETGFGLWWLWQRFYMQNSLARSWGWIMQVLPRTQLLHWRRYLNKLFNNIMLFVRNELLRLISKQSSRCLKYSRCSSILKFLLFGVRWTLSECLSAKTRVSFVFRWIQRWIQYICLWRFQTRNKWSRCFGRLYRMWRLFRRKISWIRCI